MVKKEITVFGHDLMQMSPHFEGCRRILGLRYSIWRLQAVRNHVAETTARAVGLENIADLASVQPPFYQHRGKSLKQIGAILPHMLKNGSQTFLFEVQKTDFKVVLEPSFLVFLMFEFGKEGIAAEKSVRTEEIVIIVQEFVFLKGNEKQVVLSQFDVISGGKGNRRITIVADAKVLELSFPGQPSHFRDVWHQNQAVFGHPIVAMTLLRARLLLPE